VKRTHQPARDPANPANPKRAISITDAPESPRDQFRARRRRYSTLMALRIPCLLIGACCYSIPWLAVTFIAISIPLPWMAVLIANDRPPRRPQTGRPQTGRRQTGRP
jgi:hypothetical protein